MKTKICSKCSKSLSLDNFNIRKRKNHSYTLQAECKSCAAKACRFRSENKKKRKQCSCGNYFVGYTNKCRSCHAIDGHITRIKDKIDQYNNLTNSILLYGKNSASKDVKVVSEIVIGGLLGDGCVIKYKGKNSFNFVFAHSNSHYDYSSFIANYLNSIFLSKNKINEIKERPFGKYLGKKQYNYCITNKYIFEKVRNKWYDKSGLKRVPKDLQLSPMICKIWYLDDGCLAKPDDIIISTQGFVKEDVIFLVAKLDSVGIMATKRKAQTIAITGKNVIKFLNYIGKCPVKSYEYKWDVQEWEIHEQVCSYCQKEYSYYSAKKYRKTCGRRECYLKRNRELNKINYKRRKSYATRL